MGSFSAPRVVLRPYVRSPVAPSAARRGFVLVLHLLAAGICGLAAVALPQQLIVILFVPTILCILVVLWMMPDRVVFPYRAVEKGYAVTLCLTLAWPNYIAVVVPGLPWLTPTRIALFVLTFLFLYSVSSSSMLRRHLMLVARSSPLLWAAFLVWQLSMIISLPFSGSLIGSIKGLIDNQLDLTLMFFVGCLVFARRGGPTWMVRLLVILAFLWAVDGFIEMRLGYPPWAYSIPSFMKIDDVSLAGILGSQARSADGLYRVHGPYVNSLVFAEFLATCTPFLIHYLLTGRTLFIRAAMAIIWPCVIVAITLTQSRLGLVATILSIGAYVPLWAYKQWRANPTSIIGPSLLFGAPIIALGVIATIFSSHRLTTRVLGGGAQASSDIARSMQVQMGIPKIATYPLGHGIHQCGVVLGFVAPNGQLTIDNYYLATLLDLGFPGALGFFGMFAVAAWLGVRLYLKANDRESELAGPLAVTFLNFLIIKWVLSEEHNHSLLLLLLGMIAALVARARNLINPDALFPKWGVGNNVRGRSGA